MRLVFCGTPAFAVPTLQRLFEEGFEIRVVVTQPDRPRGRGMQLEATPVKQRAIELGLPIIQPEKIKNNDAFREQLKTLTPEAIIVVGYGRIIPQWMIDLPRYGNINLHASMLPKYRGAAPIQWAIANGETVTGVTTMRIDSGLDTGDILQQRELSITPDDTAISLSPRLAAIGSELMIETLRALHEGTIQPRVQDHAKATLAPILTKEEGRINFKLSANQLYNRMRGFQPWPGAFTTFRKKSLRIWQARPVQLEILQGQLITKDGQLFVGCASKTSLLILELQPDGKKRMLAHDFIHGYRPGNGEILS